jgi:hypothetical protein
LLGVLGVEGQDSHQRRVRLGRRAVVLAATGPKHFEFFGVSRGAR